MPKIYLAGPTVFEPDARNIFSKMKEICKKHGLEGVAPLDNQLGLENIEPSKELTLRIVGADFELMDRLDGAIFCLNAFRRSTEMDPGTAVEIGYMKAEKKRLMGWTTDAREYPEKVKDHFKEIYHISLNAENSSKTTPASGLLRDPDGILVHSEGMYQNGMTQGAIEISGGHVFYSPDWEVAFDLAAQSLALQFKLAERDLVSRQAYKERAEKKLQESQLVQPNANNESVSRPSYMH